jgi:hypothetical protein
MKKNQGQWLTWVSVFLFLFLLLAEPVGFASEDKEWGKVRRSYRVAPSLSYLTHNSDIKGAEGSVGGLRLGTGLVGQGGYRVSKSTTFAVSLGFWNYSKTGANSMWQLVYGGTLRHAFKSLLGSDTVYPYFEYGLLIQQVALRGVSGSAAAHDTKSALGLNFPMFNEIGFFEFGFHLSQLRFFKHPSANLSRFEVSLGLQFDPVQ